MTEQTPPERENIQPVPLGEALSERYLAYALSTIVSRSLPDVRDGLKPVHRRLLYAMRLLRLDPDAGFKKCARIVGDVMGKFHPHGDSAIYDALVRLAQDFAVRYPLVEGQGNFGNVDGDNAAAMRYTEARLTEIAERLLEGIDEDAVDFQPTYDGEESEPIVLPSAFPNLLANGASGIAVGMATNIPPHNATELCEALELLIRKPSASVAELMEHVPGPDFPTGGILTEDRARIVEAYETGRGSLRLRARWEKEETGRGGYQIVVHELPYQVQKGKLVEKIAGLINDRKLPALADVRDESADDVRLVLEPRARTVDADALMEQLFRQTDLEVRFGLNMNVLDATRTPRVMSLKEALVAFLDHRHVVLERRTRHRLAKIADRLEVLGGYLVAFLNLDEVIRIIRTEDRPKEVLISRFELTERQAQAILDMRLRQLRKLEELELRKEHEALTAEQADLEALLADEKRRWKTIAGQIRELRKWLTERPDLGLRRTGFAEAPSEELAQAAEEILVEKEPITVICSEKGWIRAARGHIDPGSELKFKEGDRSRFVIQAQTTDRLLVVATNGRIFTLPCDRLPGGRGHGEPIRLMVDMDNEHDIVDLFVHKPGRKRLIASDAGRGFVFAEDEVLASTRNGKQVLNVGAGEEAKCAVPVPAESDMVAVIGENRKLLVFPLEELPEMTRGKGVMLQRYRDGGLADIKCFAKADGLTWTTASGRVMREDDLMGWLGKRASAGRLPPRGFNKSGRFG
ncbi:DNA topoisomerase IV subunit A [Minwuia thermotolerans]|uniref:DNA topoisomerase 4 subunit A n=1 Tax=Minwuia thermotolerans TaxID=2056226 RepID=A0A2M9FZX3_9PROT|nr:DNA topoisomerase IV subunit A [Minwuia thermotolerans]PJK28989.1 DNA topoisomerase IV subunit A [Minwuia thermotolerans]